MANKVLSLSLVSGKYIFWRQKINWLPYQRPLGDCKRNEGMTNLSCTLIGLPTLKYVARYANFCCIYNTGTQMSNEISGVTGLNFTKILHDVARSLPLLMRPSPFRMSQQRMNDFCQFIPKINCHGTVL